MEHLDLDQMMAAAEATTRSQSDHLTGCRRCADEVAAWRLVLAAARADRSGEPSARGVTAARRLFD